MMQGALNNPVNGNFAARPPIPTPPPGSLLIRDTFMPTMMGMGPTETPHGRQVLQAVQNAGFKGQVVPSLVDPPQPTGFLPQVREAHNELGTKALTQEQALAQLTRVTETEASAFLNDQSGYLERMTKSGVKNSAANFSLGMSKASTAVSLYDRAISSLNSEGGAAGAMMAAAGGAGPKTMENYATAFGLDLDKLKSKDPKVHGPERKKLQEALINHVSNTYDKSPTIAKSKTRWDKAVNDFEANKNSVVISAGNEGDFAEMLASGNDGLTPKVPADFEKNLLENDAVTSVGATQVTRGNGNAQETRASYSSVSGGVDIYANGTLSEDGPWPIQGTSFSSPQVGATMAQLHKDNPTLSSAQIETLMLNRLTDRVADGQSTINVLDNEETRDYLSNAN